MNILKEWMIRITMLIIAIIFMTLVVVGLWKLTETY